MSFLGFGVLDLRVLRIPPLFADRDAAGARASTRCHSTGRQDWTRNGKGVRKVRPRGTVACVAFGSVARLNKQTTSLLIFFFIFVRYYFFMFVV